MTEKQIEEHLITTLRDSLKYTYRPDITTEEALNKNFREKFDALHGVTLTDGEFSNVLKEIISPDVFLNATRLREKHYFEREDGTPLYYSLVNIKDWCKNDFEVINQLRVNTEKSNHR